MNTYGSIVLDLSKASNFMPFPEEIPALSMLGCPAWLKQSQVSCSSGSDSKKQIKPRADPGVQKGECEGVGNIRV